MDDLKKLKVSPILKRLGGETGPVRVSGFVARLSRKRVTIRPSLDDDTTLRFAKADILSVTVPSGPGKPASFLLRPAAGVTRRERVAARDLDSTLARRKDDGGPGGGTGPSDCLIDYVGDVAQCFADYVGDLQDETVSGATAEVNRIACENRAKRRLSRCEGTDGLGGGSVFR